MKVIIESLAKKCLDDIFRYNFQYSSKNAIATDMSIMQNIENLKFFSLYR